LPRSQPQAGNAYSKALPALTAAELLQGHFQLEPGNEILEGFWVKLTPMSNAVPYK